MSVAEWLTLIGAISAAVVSVINAVKTSTKLETISKDTNGNLSALKAELAMERHVRVIETRIPNAATAVKPRG